MRVSCRAHWSGVSCSGVVGCVGLLAIKVIKAGVAGCRSYWFGVGCSCTLGCVGLLAIVIIKPGIASGHSISSSFTLGCVGLLAIKVIEANIAASGSNRCWFRNKVGICIVGRWTKSVHWFSVKLFAAQCYRLGWRWHFRIDSVVDGLRIGNKVRVNIVGQGRYFRISCRINRCRRLCGVLHSAWVIARHLWISCTVLRCW